WQADACPDRRGRAPDGEPRPARAREGGARGRRRLERRGCPVDGEGERLRRDHPRRDAAGDERVRDLPPPSRGGDLGAGPDVDRARLSRGPRRGPRHRRRRLPREAVRVRRAARPAAGADAPRRTRTADGADGRRPPPRPRDSRGLGGQQRGHAVRKGVRAARDVHAAARRGAVTAAPARARVGLRVREPVEHRRRLRPPSAEQDRRAVRPERAADGARRRVPAPRRNRGLTRVPIRIRIAAAFAIAMAAVLAATGFFLYARLDSHLTTALDHNLLVRAQDVTALISRPGATLAREASGHFVENGESYAQLLTLDGHVVDATTPLGRARLLSADELARARRGTVFADRESVPGLDEPSRLLATPIERRGRRLILAVGATRQDRAEALASLRNELLLAGPAALVLATVAGYLLAGLSLRPV